MAHEHTIKFSDPLKREYNTISLHNEEDPKLIFDFSGRPSYKDSAYNITIYADADRKTIVSRPIDKDKMEVEIPDYSFGSMRAIAVVEDRSDKDKIDAIETVAYLYFNQFCGGTDRDVEGHIEYKDTDGSTFTIPYYTNTGFLIK